MALQDFQYRTASPNNNQNPFGSLFSLAVLGVSLFVMFYILRGLVHILYQVAPFLLPIALIIDYKTVLAYFKSLINNFKTSVLQGILRILFLVFGYPFVFLWLVFTASINRRMNTTYTRNEQTFNLSEKNEFTPYEEIDSKLNDKNNAPL